MTWALALVLVVSPSSTRAAGVGVRLAPARAARIDAAVSAASLRWGVPGAVLLATIEVESAFDPAARSGAGCHGLLQLAPATAREVARWIGLRRYALHNIEDNVRLGAAYLVWLAARYGGWGAALTAYNVGIGRFERRGRKLNDYSRKVLTKAGQIGTVGT